MDLPQRKNPRLPGYDYSSNGAYFVTVCTHNREQTLSDICRDDPCGRPRTYLTALGKLAAEAFDAVEKTYPVSVDYRVIMPDHIHFIVFIPEREPGIKPVSLGLVVGAYKSFVS